MVKKVVHSHFGRCGSTALAEMLAQQIQITRQGEIFQPRLREARKKFGWRLRSEGGDPVADAQENPQHAKTAWPGIKARPFHLAPYEISAAQFIEGTRQTGEDCFVALERRNRLRFWPAACQVDHRQAAWWCRPAIEAC